MTKPSPQVTVREESYVDHKGRRFHARFEVHAAKFDRALMTLANKARNHSGKASVMEGAISVTVIEDPR